jgi:energy-coupling factor transporter ATP-binding protein EcfA2
VFSVLADLAAEGQMTVVLVEHELEWIGDYADRVIVMDNGRIVQDGDPHVVLADEALIEMGVGNTTYTTIARQAREAGLVPSDRPLPVTLNQAVEYFKGI